MNNILKIECIGNPKLGDRPAWVDWVKDISHHGMVKERLKGQIDYSQANSVGSRGVYKYYFLLPRNLYHVSAPQSWSKIKQYFCIVNEDTNIKELSFKEAIEWLLRRKQERMYMMNPGRGFHTSLIDSPKSTYRSPGEKTQA